MRHDSAEYLKLIICEIKNLNCLSDKNVNSIEPSILQQIASLFG